MPNTDDRRATDQPTYLGDSLIALLGLQAPEDPFERRAQRAIVSVQAATAFSFLVQSIVVAVTEDLTRPFVRGRLVGVAFTSLVLGAILFVSRAGRLRLSGRLSAGVTILLLRRSDDGPAWERRRAHSSSPWASSARSSSSSRRD